MQRKWDQQVEEVAAMSIPKDGYYMAKVQLDTGGMCPHYVRVKDGKPYSQWGDDLLPEACSEFQEVDTTLMVRVWPEDAAMKIESLRAANAGLVEKVKRLEEAGKELGKASRKFLLTHVDDDDGNEDAISIDQVNPESAVQWEDPPSAGEHIRLRNAINDWNRAKGQP